MSKELFTQVLESGVNISLCYQCKTCSLGCPFSSEMDILPHQIIRAIQVGEANKILGSNAIWRCASCETCFTRCPNGIDIPRIMDILRQRALQKKGSSRDNISVFHKAFLDSVRRWGRQYELGMLLDFKLKSANLFSDIPLGIKMLIKGKIPFFPPGSESRKDMKRLLKALHKSRL